MKYKGIISDAGDILFSTESQRKLKREIISELIGDEISIEEAQAKFKPYNDLAQTTHKLWEAFILFSSQELNKHISVVEAKRIARQLYPSRNQISPKIIETLEDIKSKEVPFVILTNGPLLGIEYSMLMGSELSKLIKAQVSSKDVGARKPHPLTFNFAYNALGASPNYREVLYIAHTQSEILGAADQGFQVVACQYQDQKDAEEIERRIEESEGKIISIGDFTEITDLL